MSETLTKLKSHLQQVTDLQNAAAVLYWDLEVMMPEGGAAPRASALDALAHCSRDGDQRRIGDAHRRGRARVWPARIMTATMLRCCVSPATTSMKRPVCRPISSPSSRS
ncbi:MAG: hypothetical protein HND48_14710 [Chloroflexi bacterium]|nr:hypothetical protein [Chloroflexota bacterium]